MVTVLLPRQFTIGSLPHFVGQIVAADGTPKDREFTFDFHSLGFIDGAGLTVFTNAMGWLKKRECKVYFTRFRDRSGSEPIRYLDSCGFFQRHIRESLSPFNWPRDTTLPCTRLSRGQGHAWLDGSFVPWVARVLQADPRALISLKTCVKEVLVNVEDHSTEEIASVHVQHYPNVNRVGITISDFGTGIPANIKRVFGPMNDGEAILRASEEGVTTKTNPRNQGKGLNYLIDTIAHNGGTVRIVSFTGELFCQPWDGGSYRRPSTNGSSYPGTLVDIQLSTRSFVGDEVEDSEWDF